MSLKYGSQNDRWHKNYKQLQKFVTLTKQIPGKQNETALYRWMVHQQDRYFNEMLSEDKKWKLTELGVQFIRTDFNTKWDNNYSLLVAFLKKYNRWPLPTSTGVEKKLYLWCQSQRQVYVGTDKRRKPMPQYRIDMLNQLDFCWSAKEKHERFWNRKFEELTAFIKKEQRFIPTKINGKSNKIYSWITAQKKLFRIGKLQETRLQRLLSLGIVLK